MLEINTKKKVKVLRYVLNLFDFYFFVKFVFLIGRKKNLQFVMIVFMTVFNSFF